MMRSNNALKTLGGTTNTIVIFGTTNDMKKVIRDTDDVS